jgi:hypothetical protein
MLSYGQKQKIFFNSFERVFFRDDGAIISQRGSCTVMGMRWKYGTLESKGDTIWFRPKRRADPLKWYLREEYLGLEFLVSLDVHKDWSVLKLKLDSLIKEDPIRKEYFTDVPVDSYAMTRIKQDNCQKLFHEQKRVFDIYVSDLLYKE